MTVLLRWRGIILAIFVVLVAVTLMRCGPPDVHDQGALYHHMDGGFRNARGSPEYEVSWRDMVGAYTDRFWENFTGYEPQLAPESVLKSNVVYQGLQRVKDADSLTWLGHASFLIELNGTTLLTDPFLSEYATGIAPFGPRRSTPPALTVEELPEVQIIVISHNHFDHLDAPTIEAMPNKDKISVVVPLGLGEFFTERGYSQVVELDWYSVARIGGVEIMAVPAVHGSARGLFDRDETLWAGYIIGDDLQKIYFSGDTAYGPIFKDMGREFGPVDYALVPVGAYEPRHRMRSVHANPEEAVAIAQDLRAKTVIAMHWGTIRLSNESFQQQAQAFRKAADARGLSAEQAWILKIGESRFLDKKSP